MSSRQKNRIIAAIGLIVDIDGKPHPCLTANVSMAGLYVMLKHKAPVGTRVGLTVPLEPTKLRTTARIATNDGRGLGLSLDFMDDEFENGWRRLIKKLLRRATVDLGAEPLDIAGTIAWSRFPDGRLWTIFQKRHHKDALASLSLDGAAFKRRRPPDVGAPLLVFITEVEDDVRQEHHCQAEVVRHTDDGFAVRFDAPGIEFRRALTRLRSGAQIE